MYKILIRPLAIEDAYISWKWRNDAEVWAQTGSSPDKSITLDIENEWIEKAIKDDTANRFAITVDDQYVGNVQLTNITDSEAQFHIFIGEKSFWGKGVANQATYQILNYAKEILKLDQVYLYVKKSNVAAIKVYQKNSFIEDGQDVEQIRMTCNLIDLVPPMVSIFCMVYNHEKYISDAIEGFLMQKNNFNTVIVIGEDCSTDGSRNVINSCVERFPGKFRLIYHNVNIGAVKNQDIVFQNCKGYYIAMCEGDDYWTDPLKLQKQVDFLEKHGDYSLCFHNTNVIDNSTGKTIYNLRRHFGNKTFSTSAIIKGGGSFSATSSMLFRNQIISKLPSWFDEVPVGDLFLSILCAMSGKAYYIDNPMSVYNINNSSWSASMQDSYINRYNLHFKIVKSIKEINEVSNYRYNKPFKTLISKHIKAILSDKCKKEFEYKNKKLLFNELNINNKIDLVLLKYIPVIPKIYKKGINFIKMIF
jgi:RimJ/RimL family protein N-acetyltransferase/glycosyltransferase involved in cell wall biosynthesis